MYIYILFVCLLLITGTRERYLPLQYYTCEEVPGLGKLHKCACEIVKYSKGHVQKEVPFLAKA